MSPMGNCTVLTDHLGSAQVTAAEGGAASGVQRYTAFGEVRSRGGEMPTAYQYTGQLSQMEQVGLYHYGARWFDPAGAHFTQADTLVPNPINALDWDRYSYARNNPIKYTDPTGHAVACMNDDLSNGCAGLGMGDLQPAQIINTDASEDVKNQAIYNYSITHPDYNYAIDADLEDTGRFIVGNAIFIGNADAIYRLPSLLDRIKNSWTAFASGASLTIAGIIVGGGSERPEASLHNGMKLSVDDALDAATQFLGPGYIEIEPGRFVSKDGFRQVRMKSGDLAGHGTGQSHMNFETLAVDPKTGKKVITQNYHIYLNP
ncbi:RHS repeat-associated core domain-containing protein [Levilinea saccharolytica]|uniref:RHS repeat-associated core domain-containing protein n=1 Tax=Levilinea saccharolytica TaxID=229921 RepID=UPI00136497A8|nr:RHS repeat-associated core domain-containing protein [Levilinea saccharolytica]